jgi:hypothetical protein
MAGSIGNLGTRIWLAPNGGGGSAGIIFYCYRAVKINRPLDSDKVKNHN